MGMQAVWMSIGAALRFVREQWRFVLIVAAAGALAHAFTVAALGATLLFLPMLMIVSVAVHAVLTRAALAGVGAVQSNAGADTLRTLGAMTIVGLFAALVGIVLFYVAASILLAPFAEQAKAVAEDEAALRALMERAVRERPDVLRWAGLIGAFILFALTSRFYFAAPGSVDNGKVQAIQSWVWSRGHILRIMLARVVLLGPALVLAAALQSLVGIAVGVGADDPIAMLTRAQANPGAFLAFYAGAQFVQIATFSSLEAGLSAHLYRTLVKSA